MFSSAGERPVFDTMGRGDIDGDQYYVISHNELVRGLSLPSARDYESQSAFPPTHGLNPCNPSANHRDPPLRDAFTKLRILTKPHTGGVRGLSRAVTEWMATCDQLGASSSTAIQLVDLVMKAHSVRSLSQSDLELFEEEFARQVQGPQLARPAYLAQGAQITESDSVVGLLALRATTAAEQITEALRQLKHRPAEHAQIMKELVASCLRSDNAMANEVQVEELEFQRALARSQQEAEQHVQPQPKHNCEESDWQMAQMLHSEINNVQVVTDASLTSIDTQIQELVQRRDRLETELVTHSCLTICKRSGYILSEWCFAGECRS